MGGKLMNAQGAGPRMGWWGWWCGRSGWGRGASCSQEKWRGTAARGCTGLGVMGGRVRVGCKGVGGAGRSGQARTG